MYAPNTSYPSSDVEMLSCGFSHPDEIVRDNSLSLEEKRGILASWASDARSIKDHPAYRLIDAGQVVPIDEILEAIAQLEEETNPLALSDEKRGNRKKPHERDDDDDPDDDPPPLPAGVFVPLPPLPPMAPELAV